MFDFENWSGRKKVVALFGAAAAVCWIASAGSPDGVNCSTVDPIMKAAYCGETKASAIRPAARP